MDRSFSWGREKSNEICAVRLKVRHHYKLHPVIRSLLVLSMFFVMLSTALFWNFYPSRKGDDQGVNYAEKSEKQNKKNKLFYKSIGKSPANLHGYSEEKNLHLGQYTIELAIVKNSRTADKYIEKMAKKGINGYYTPVHYKGKTYYRVRTGIFKSIEDAKVAASKMKLSPKSKTKIKRM